MTHTRAKGQGQRSLNSEVIVETYGWMEAIYIKITSHANAVGNNYIAATCCSDVHGLYNEQYCLLRCGNFCCISLIFG